MPIGFLYAQILGITFITAGLTLLLEKKLMREVLKGLISNRTLIYVLGVIDLILGLVIVLTHNIWQGPTLLVVVTIMGWLLLIKGILRMMLPTSFIKRVYTKYYKDAPLMLSAIIILALGIYMAYAGFHPYLNYYY